MDKLYQIGLALEPVLLPKIGARTFARVVLLVAGMIKGSHASPARIAAAAETLGITGASAASIERRVRRIENDPHITAARCFHPLATAWLAAAKLDRIILVIDPTCQDERLVLLSVGVWYRGRTLPLAWSIWPGNKPIASDGPERFWERVGNLLREVKQELLPAGVPVVILADRAFGCPAFTDQVSALGWQYVVRVQDQVRCEDRRARRFSIASLVRLRGQRAKQSGRVFKKQGWRDAGVVVWWSRSQDRPLCLVTNMRPRFCLVALYRRRYGIEAGFRDLKSHGWQFEQGQVRSVAHVATLLVSVAIATWLTIGAGVQAAQRLLEKIAAAPTRRSRPRRGPGPETKLSLFQLGRHAFERHWTGVASVWLGALEQGLPQWEAPSWKQQVINIYGRIAVFHQ